MYRFISLISICKNKPDVKKCVLKLQNNVRNILRDIENRTPIIIGFILIALFFQRSNGAFKNFNSFLS